MRLLLVKYSVPYISTSDVSPTKHHQTHDTECFCDVRHTGLGGEAAGPRRVFNDPEGTCSPSPSYTKGMHCLASLSTGSRALEAMNFSGWRLRSGTG